MFILPRVRWLGERVEGALSGLGGADRLAAGNLKHQLLKVLAPVVRQLRQPPDLPEEYKLVLIIAVIILYSLDGANWVATRWY